jgi:hypothetical protein
MLKIRFVTGSDITSTLIRFGERDGWATHVEAVLSDGSLLGAHLDGGVQIRPAGYDKATVSRELIISAPVAITTETIFYDFLHAQVGKPYDLTAIAAIELGRDWRKPDHWICSELIAAALEACGYFEKLSAADSKIDPRDVLLLLSSRLFIPNAT